MGYINKISFIGHHEGQRNFDGASYRVDKFLDVCLDEGQDNQDIFNTVDKVSAEVRSGREGGMDILIIDVAYIGGWYKNETYFDLSEFYNE